MSPALYMLDTNICSFFIRRRPDHLVTRFETEHASGSQLVVSAITYAELRFGASGTRASPRHALLVDEFVARLDGVLAWDAAAVEATDRLQVLLREAGTPIGSNDAAIAGHALSVDAIVVTTNIREFTRVPGLRVEDWVADTSPDVRA